MSRAVPLLHRQLLIVIFVRYCYFFPTFPFRVMRYEETLLLATVPVLLINLRLFDSLILRPSILKPYLDLCFRQTQHLCQFYSAHACDVLCPVVFHLEFDGLFTGECCPLAALPVFLSTFSSHWLDKDGKRKHSAINWIKNNYYYQQQKETPFLKDY